MDLRPFEEADRDACVALVDAPKTLEFVDAYCAPTAESVQAKVLEMVGVR